MKKYIIICVTLIIICIIFLYCKTSAFNKLYDDILFFKLFDKEKQYNEISKEENNSQYIFDVSYKKTDIKNISLLDTIKKENLIEDILAPGTEGTFDIVLVTNSDTKYQVNFKSISSKPQNLKFENLETKEKVNQLEELNLRGILQKNKTKTITIHWYWEYENTREGDIQDTIDSKNIKNYEFNISTIGEKRG